MPTRISEPGIYEHFPVADYFADPCPQPSLTQSICKKLIQRSPLHAWHCHPRLNPDFVADHDKKFDIGNVAHQLLIGRGKDIEIIDAPDWRTKAAQNARDEAIARGLCPVLGKHHQIAQRMVAAAREQLDDRALGHLFQTGIGEAVMAWKDPFWCRSMIDWLAPKHLIVADYKTTSSSAAPQDLSRRMADHGWHIQAAMAERGLHNLVPDNAGRWRFLFVVQEVERPYCLSVAEVSESVLTYGRRSLGQAFETWRTCTNLDLWPAYQLEIQSPDLPPWASAEYIAQDVATDRQMLVDLRGG
jgi:hypothetical protein